MGIYRSSDGRRAVQDWCRRRLEAWERPHEASTVSTPLGSTHVVTCGQGPDLVLVPGTNFAAATWLDLVDRLAAGHTVHAVDLPGQPGLSTEERPRGVVARHGTWLTGLVSTLGLARPTVVAHSLGAVAALRAAAEGAGAGRLLLVDPAGVMRLRVGPSVMRPTMPWLRRPDDDTSAGLLRMMAAPGTEPDPDLVSWMTLVGRHVRTSLAPSPVPARTLRSIPEVPVDVLCGRHDAFLPPDRLGRAVARRLPAAGFEVVDRAGHLLPHERPDAIVDRLRSPVD